VPAAPASAPVDETRPDVPRRRPLIGRAKAPLSGTGRSIYEQLIWLGQLLVFCFEVMISLPVVAIRFRKEVVRLLAEVTFGAGLLAVAASTVLVASLLAAVIGIQLGVEGLQGLNILGLAPLAGLLAAFGNTRELSPLIVAFALAAQMGCRFTAQLGAMRVTEEIDALEVMSIPSLQYLVTTRMIAVLVAIVPLYLLALSGAYLASQFTVLFVAHQGAGTYNHYFHLFLTSGDIFYSILKVVILGILITFVHCYYGFNATGGPEGVGQAAGRAIRCSVVMIAVVDMLMTMLFWGISSGIKVSG
jgi:phospholipid/cholesterol/gamma-HCH transport system permease protein